MPHDFVGAKYDGGGGDKWSYRRAKLQSNRYHQHHKKPEQVEQNYVCT